MLQSVIGTRCGRYRGVVTLYAIKSSEVCFITQKDILIYLRRYNIFEYRLVSIILPGGTARHAE